MTVDARVRPRRIRTLKGADLLKTWVGYGNQRLHPQGHICRACEVDMSSVGITSIVYTFEICKCDRAPYSHLFEQLWHRKCFFAHSSAVLGL